MLSSVGLLAMSWESSAKRKTWGGSILGNPPGLARHRGWIIFAVIVILLMWQLPNVAYAAGYAFGTIEALLIRLTGG